jgi:hypothetical protein
VWCVGERTVCDDIDDVTDLVCLEVGRERDLGALASVADGVVGSDSPFHAS